MSDEIARVARNDERIARIKEVGKWHFRHLSSRQIAEKCGLSLTTVTKYIAIIKDRMQGLDDIDVFIRDVVARTMEELDRLQEQEVKLWELLDWASTPVHDTKWDKDTKESEPIYIDGVPLMKPRSPGYITQATAQMQQVIRMRAELLKLIGNKVDISINLQFAQKTQVLILEKMAELAPEHYRQLRAEIAVLADQFEKGGEKVALGTSKDVFDAAYSEIPDGE